MTERESSKVIGQNLPNLLSDTSPKAEAVLIAGYRKMDATAKLLKVAELNQMLVAFITADVRRRHPNASEIEIRLRVASRWIPPKLMKKAFGWDPQEKGY